MFERDRRPLGGNGGGPSLPIVLDSRFDPKWVVAGTPSRKDQVSSQSLPNPRDIDRAIENIASIPGVRDLYDPGYFRATSEMNSIGASLLIAGEFPKAGSSFFGAERRLGFVRQSFSSMKVFGEIPGSSGAAQLQQVAAKGNYVDIGRYTTLAPSLRVFEAAVRYNIVCLILTAQGPGQEASAIHQRAVDWLEEIPSEWRTAGWELVRIALSSVGSAVRA